MKLRKYHGLGNDYLVATPEEFGSPSNLGQRIQAICDRHMGAGSDGILLGPFLPDSQEFKRIAQRSNTNEKPKFALRIYNPDGSEAEKSGNGLRIFTQFLFDSGLVGNEPFKIATMGGIVTSVVNEPYEDIMVQMGKVTFDSSLIPVKGERREVLAESIKLGGKDFTYSAASIGNPHCIVLCDEVSKSLALEFGPLFECEARFTNKTNVQFMKVLSDQSIFIEIWERGAGYTLASGSSASAAACVAHKLGLCGQSVLVKMPGGNLEVKIDDEWNVVQHGPVKLVYDMDFYE